jgi:beta-barrel assembly-enhancing protease
MKKLIPGAMVCAVLVTFTAGEAVGGQLGAITKRAKQFRDIQMSDEDEQRLGEAVSQRIRERYGVVQDPAVHKYVTLVGRVLASASSRPDLTWRFIVLDTDGVNALAAPGGYIHITRGALSLLRSEAELAGVLGHEIEHVTEKHTIKAIQKSKAIQMGAEETLSGNAALFNKLVDKASEMVMAGFGRSEELEADRDGVELANKAGYAPDGLAAFLRTIMERNKNSSEKQGLFASHPEMEERLTKLGATIKSKKLAAPVTLEARLSQHITYKPVPVDAVATVPQGAAGLTGGSGKPAEDEEKKTEEPPKKKRGFGLSSLRAPSLGSEKKSAEVTGSGASRGVDRERDAKGGSNPKAVAVTISAADLAAFKKEGGLP